VKQTYLENNPSENWVMMLLMAHVSAMITDGLSMALTAQLVLGKLSLLNESKTKVPMYPYNWSVGCGILQHKMLGGT